MTDPADNPAFETDDPVLAPVLDDLKRIAAMKDGALRNLLITQRYRDISEATREVLGGENLNWCTFACWASKTAGESIRGDELPDIAEVFLRHESFIEKSIGRIKAFFGFAPMSDDLKIFDDVREILGGVSEQIALGNLKVYAEIAPLFARFKVQLGPASDAPAQSEPDEGAWNKFASIIRPGLPDEGDGQDYLEQAFRQYYEARFARDKELAAEKILLANVLVGLHEQTRLQSAIKNAMDVPAVDGLHDLLGAAAKKRLPQSQHHLVAAEVKKLPHFVKLAVIETWERIATKLAMKLALPDGKFVWLGRDVPLVNGRMYPEELVTISLPPLRDVRQKYVNNPDSTGGSGADDWSELKQRMNFIFQLFRANQQNAELYQQPFQEGQRADFNAGRMPTDRKYL